MNKIQELIKELCPNGVEWKKLGEIFTFRNGYTPSTTNESFWNGGTIPWFKMEDLRDNGKILKDSNLHITPIAVKGDKLFKANSILIATSATIGEHALILVEHLSNQRFTNIYPRDIYESMIDMHYINHYMPIIDEWCKKNVKLGNFASVDMDKLKNYPIPLPPLPVQTEIVRILDKFVEQQEQLEKLIELRTKQYEYYREEMLTAKEGWETVTIGDLCTITRGRRFVRDDVRSSGMPCIHYGDMYTYYGITARTTKTFLDRDFPKKMQYAKKGDVVVVGAGENDLDIGVGTVWEGDEPAAVHDACYILEHKQNPKYIAYFLRTNNYHQQLRKFVSEGKICSISGTGLGSCFIPLPSLTKQQEIVDFLDKFEDNISVMKSALELSKKRYEHYRDEMLRF